jgi:16S rRNA G966 N2-methylase RsmD
MEKKNNEKNILMKIFPQNNMLEMLKYDNEGLWSITLPEDADIISQMILSELNSEITIMDCTAGLGGNIISFSKFFKKTIGIEINPDRFKMLDNNITICCPDNLNNIHLIHGNFLDYIESIDADCYFIDPPWGGPDYKFNIKTKIKIDNVALLDIIKIIKNKNDTIIVIKLPCNYNIDEFIEFNYKITKIKNYMVLIF